MFIVIFHFTNLYFSLGVRGDKMNFSFSADNLINQYSLFAIPFLILISGILISRFTIGGNKK